MLSTKLYGVVEGIATAVATLIPCVGLILLLVIIREASDILRQNGIRVGLFGAELRDL